MLAAGGPGMRVRMLARAPATQRGFRAGPEEGRGVGERGVWCDECSKTPACEAIARYTAWRRCCLPPARRPRQATLAALDLVIHSIGQDSTPQIRARCPGTNGVPPGSLSLQARALGIQALSRGAGAHQARPHVRLS